MAERATTAHTANLTPADTAHIRGLLDEGFEGDFTDDDFEHAFGGIHAMVWLDGALIAHGSVVMRRILHEGHALRTGYVEAVAVRRDHRGNGHAGAVMAALEEVVRRAYDLGALSTSEAADGFYQRRGWQRWPGTVSVLTPARGISRMRDEEGAVFVLPVNCALVPGGDLACDWRNGDVW